MIPARRFGMALSVGILVTGLLAVSTQGDDLSTYRLGLLRDGELLFDLLLEGDVNEFRSRDDTLFVRYRGGSYLPIPVRWQRDGFTTAGGLELGVGDLMVLGVELGLGPWSGYYDPRYEEMWSPASRGYAPSMSLVFRPVPTLELFGEASYRRLELDRPPWPLGHPEACDVDLDRYCARGGVALLMGARSGRVRPRERQRSESLDAYLLPLLAPGRVLLTLEGTYEELQKRLVPAGLEPGSTEWCLDIWPEESNVADALLEEGARGSISGGLEVGLADGLAAGVRLRLPVEWGDGGSADDDRYSPTIYLAARPGGKAELGGTYTYTARDGGSEQSIDVGLTYLGTTGGRFESRRAPASRGVARYRLPLLLHNRYLLALGAGHTQGVSEGGVGGALVEAKEYRFGTDFSYGLRDNFTIAFSAAGSREREWSGGSESRSSFRGRLGIEGVLRPNRKTELRCGLEYSRQSVEEGTIGGRFDRDGLGMGIGAVLLFGAY